MIAKIFIDGKKITAKCAKCGRHLVEVHGSSNILVRCPSCKVENSVLLKLIK